MKLSRVSIAVLIIQLAIVSSIAAKYLYQRWTCPRVWTRAVAYDPELVMRGRYLSTRLYVDACGLTTGKAEAAVANAPNVPGYLDLANGSTYVQGKIGVQDGKLSVLHLEETASEKDEQPLVWPHSNVCSDMELWSPVNFYLSESAKSPFPLSKGEELWVEVTVPPKGPPRPIGMATKDSTGHWQPLNYR